MFFFLIFIVITLQLSAFLPIPPPHPSQIHVLNYKVLHAISTGICVV